MIVAQNVCAGWVDSITIASKLKLNKNAIYNKLFVEPKGAPGMTWKTCWRFVESIRLLLSTIFVHFD